MNLTWHIARKDVRRLAWPTLAWLAVIAGGEVWFRANHPDFSLPFVVAVSEWEVLGRIWITILRGAEIALGFVLAASLLLEDPSAGAEQFWVTRPISGGRLLTAKLLAAAFLFVLAPAVAMLPFAWFEGPRNLLGVLGEVGQHARITLGAFAIAALARSLAQAIFITVAAAVLFGMFGYSGPPGATTLHGVWVTRETVELVLAVAGCGFVTTHQFLTRKTGLSRALFGAVAIILAAVGSLWPWDWTTWRVRPLPASDRSAIELTPRLRRIDADPKTVPDWVVRTRNTPDRLLVPVRVRDATGDELLYRGTGLTQLARRALGLRQEREAELTWHLWPVRSYRRDPPQDIRGQLEIMGIHFEEAGRLPLRVGAVVPAGKFIRIAALLENRGAPWRIVLEEIFPAGDAKAFGLGHWDWAKLFYLEAAGSRDVRFLSRSELKGIEYHSAGRAFSGLDADGLPDWRGLTLVCLRVVPDDVFQLPVVIGGLDEKADSVRQ